MRSKPDLIEVTSISAYGAFIDSVICLGYKTCSITSAILHRIDNFLGHEQTPITHDGDVVAMSRQLNWQVRTYSR